MRPSGRAPGAIEASFASLRQRQVHQPREVHGVGFKAVGDRRGHAVSQWCVGLRLQGSPKSLAEQRAGVCCSSKLTHHSVVTCPTARRHGKPGERGSSLEAAVPPSGATRTNGATGSIATIRSAATTAAAAAVISTVHGALPGGTATDAATASTTASNATTTTATTTDAATASTTASNATTTTATATDAATASTANAATTTATTTDAATASTATTIRWRGPQLLFSRRQWGCGASGLGQSAKRWSCGRGHSIPRRAAWVFTWKARERPLLRYRPRIHSLRAYGHAVGASAIRCDSESIYYASCDAMDNSIRYRGVGPSGAAARGVRPQVWPRHCAREAIIEQVC